MITRMSELFLRTLREDPADAEVPSHKLLIRAGYIRPVGPGLYSWLPLGLRVLRKIERVVREEMNAIGGQEILFPALLPRAPYEATNRWTEYGDSVFRLKDRRGNDYLLGPTHEELFTLTVKGEYSSYKDFPLVLYQIQNKYRDETRPRAGILRVREFLMKDSYSFDLDDAGLKASYHAHREAYQRIFDRLQIRYVIVSAVSGAMGGSASEEFLAESPIGEDTFVRCLESGYAANVEAVVTARPDALPVDGLPEPVVYDTGDTPTIATLVDWANNAGLGRSVTAADTLKNVMVKVRQPGGDWELLGIGLPGDREVDERRLAAALEPAEYQLLGDDDFAEYPFLVKGYIGPKALQKNGIRYLVDPRIVDGTSWITGADEPGKHVVGLVAGRDFTADGTIEAAEVRDGDPSPTARVRWCLPRHRDRPHLPARPQIHRRLRRRRARRGRQTGAPDDGLLRYRDFPAGGRHRRAASRPAGPALAAGRGTVRRASGDRQQGPRGSCRSHRAGRRSGPPGHRGAARRPSGIARVKFKDAELLACLGSSW
ncbi:proline--tRNA ligase [Mycobacterium xenopi 4042]|uniref:Proline--tRNA ligase n=1 Tax=Mycobacterium xenopi 4042 TaxID=1299334 RepID=X8E8R8_MYCXE|nr:proline--tRNA ligase [Mycobacterium xenopi 4042]